MCNAIEGRVQTTLHFALDAVLAMAASLPIPDDAIGCCAWSDRYSLSLKGPGRGYLTVCNPMSGEELAARVYAAPVECSRDAAACCGALGPVPASEVPEVDLPALQEAFDQGSRWLRLYLLDGYVADYVMCRHKCPASPQAQARRRRRSKARRANH